MYTLYEYMEDGAFYCYSVSYKDTKYRYAKYETITQSIQRVVIEGIPLNPEYKPYHIFVCTFNTIEELKETHPEVFI